jgi:hypothetical protein
MALVFYQHLGTGDVRIVTHVAGLLTLRPDALEIEWQASKVEHLRASPVWHRGEVEHRVIPLSLIESISYRPRWFSAGTIAIRARNMSALQGLPGVIGPFWTARVAKSEKPKARELVGEVELRLANHRLLEIQDGRDE